MKTPYQRWQERTDDGQALAAGWVSSKHTPTKQGEYEVRGHPDRNYLTWAYGHWWYMEEHTNGIPYWHDCGTARYQWNSKRCCDNTFIHGGDLLTKADALGNPEAQKELTRLVARCEREYQERMAKR